MRRILPASLLGLTVALLLLIVAHPQARRACGGASPTWTAASASRNDVATCVSVASSGDTINVPAGTADWSGQTSISVTIPLTIIGATTGCPTACNGGTTIQVGTMTPFLMSASNWRISGLTFEGASNGTGSIYANKSGVSTTNWRVDHCHFKDTTGRGISVSAGVSAAGYQKDFPALIDHNRFSATAMFKTVQVYGHSATAHGSWDEPLGLGGSNFVFIEDNAFVFTHKDTESTVGGFDSDGNGRFVIRYNTGQNYDIRAHGIEDGGEIGVVANVWRATHAWEIYGNTLDYTDTDYVWRIAIRGGTGVQFSNVFTGVDDAGAATEMYYLYERGDLTRTCLDYLACQGSSPYDGNQSGKWGYACYQQIGMTGADGITPMPAYQWGSTYYGSAGEYAHTGVGFEAACNYQHVQQGRDYIAATSGPASSRPAEPCTNDAGYWATDEGEWNSTNGTTPDGRLYKCSGGSWALYYTPYTYPHPLQGVTAPNAPTNVRIR